MSTVYYMAIADKTSFVSERFTFFPMCVCSLFSNFWEYKYIHLIFQENPVVTFEFILSIFNSHVVSFLFLKISCLQFYEQLLLPGK